MQSGTDVRTEGGNTTVKALYAEPFAGISGNMLLGALLDAGVPFSYLEEEFAKLPLGEYTLVHRSVNKNGIQATYFDVDLPEYHEGEHHHHGEHAPEADHAHSHHHEHRNLHDIEEILDRSALDADVIDKAKAVFLEIAKAEAKVHGTTVDNIHFHEVGAVDTILDVVGNILALQYLKIEKIFTAPVCTGYGFVQCAHGQMPVPAPATAELLEGLPHYQGTVDKEMTTPTGAALLKVLAKPVYDLPKGFVGRTIGYGAGTRDVAIPNVLRVNIGELSAITQEESQPAKAMLILECNVDDMNPQLLPYVLDKLLAAGAADAWLQPVLMKKGRPGQTVKVLCQPAQRDELTRILFLETSTLGVRCYFVQRTALERRWEMVQTDWGPVRVKVGVLDGVVVNAAPEFEDCRSLAEQSGQPLKVIQYAALQAVKKV